MAPARNHPYILVCPIALEGAHSDSAECLVTPGNLKGHERCFKIPTTSEEDLAVPLPDDQCHISLRCRTPAGDLGTACLGPEQLPPPGQVAEKCIVLSDGVQLRVLFKCVDGALAVQEEEIDYEFSLQDFLILAMSILQSLHEEPARRTCEHSLPESLQDAVPLKSSIGTGLETGEQLDDATKPYLTPKVQLRGSKEASRQTGGKGESGLKSSQRVGSTEELGARIRRQADRNGELRQQPEIASLKAKERTLRNARMEVERQLNGALNKTERSSSSSSSSGLKRMQKAARGAVALNRIAASSQNSFSANVSETQPITSKEIPKRSPASSIGQRTTPGKSPSQRSLKSSFSTWAADSPEAGSFKKALLEEASPGCDPLECIARAFERQEQALQVAPNERCTVEQHLAQSERSRVKLQQQLWETTKDSEEQIGVARQRALKRLATAQKNLLSQSRAIRGAEEEGATLSIQASELEAKCSLLTLRAAEANCVEIEVQELRRRLSGTRSMREAQERRCNALESMFTMQLEKLQPVVNTSLAEKQFLMSEVDEVQLLLKSERGLGASWHVDCDSNASRIQGLEEEARTLEVTKKQLDELRGHRRSLEEQVAQWASEYEAARKSRQESVTRECSVVGKGMEDLAAERTKLRGREEECAQEFLQLTTHRFQERELHARTVASEQRLVVMREVEQLAAMTNVRAQCDTAIRSELEEVFLREKSEYDTYFSESRAYLEEQEAEREQLQIELRSATVSEPPDDLHSLRDHVLALEAERDRLQMELSPESKSRLSPASRSREELKKGGVWTESDLRQIFKALQGRRALREDLLSQLLRAANQRWQQFLEWQATEPREYQPDEMEVRAEDVQLVVQRIDELSKAYVPAKDDALDNALAELINSYRPPVPFFRLSQGVYLFGSRKALCHEKNGRIVLRSGGGFLGFKEFLQAYASEELMKLEDVRMAGKSRPSTY